MRTEYRRAIQYSLHSLTSYVEKYGNKNTVLVFLGDHQPVPKVTPASTPAGTCRSRSSPTTPKVLKRISDWGWTDGLKPAATPPSGGWTPSATAS